MLKSCVNRWLNKAFPENACGTDNKDNRDAWLKKTLEDVPAEWRILDAGAGELRYKPLCSHLDYVAQDFGKYDGHGDGSGLQTKTWDQSKLDIVSDICSIPEPDGSFDAIMCIEVLEHLPEPRRALKEFSRLLKPGGTLILTAPFCSLTHFAPYHYSTGFSRFFYEQALPEFGFEIDELEHNGNYFSYLAQEMIRLPSIVDKYAEHPATPSRLKNFLQYWAGRIILSQLNDAEHADTGSSELLCFGLHIKARKQ